METVIKSYIRNADRSPRGIAVAVRNGDEVTYGFSLLNTVKDKWDDELGLKIAIARANSVKGYQLPDVEDRQIAVLDAFRKLEERAIKYFKDVDPALISFDDCIEG